MSAAGTPSTDPWVVLARERARYEEQFKSLKPNNGIITGEQAKGFFLQSQLPPLVLGQIWGLADTDADGKMDINEFSIACKLINLKLRGFEVPKGIPPSLLASLKVNTPPAIPPLPNPSLMNLPPARPDPPKISPLIGQPLVQNNPALISTSQPLLHGLGGEIVTQDPNVLGMGAKPAQGVVPPVSMMSSNMGAPVSSIPTGIVPPMQSNIQSVQPLIGGIPPMNSAVPPIMSQPVASQPVGFGVPLLPGLVSSATSISSKTGMFASTAPISSLSSANGITPLPSSVNMPPLLSSTANGHPLTSSNGMPLLSSTGVLPISSAAGVPPSAAPLIPGIPSSVPPMVTNTVNVAPISVVSASPLVSVGQMSPAGVLAQTAPGPGATSTPRASITSLDRTASIESVMQLDWSVPHQTKLKYTQIFNTTDRTRTGYLSGAQARNVMVQTKLPQNILAQIWALSDMDADGRLGCEEFVLAMHLCEQAALGTPPPTKLPPDLIPPSFRRTTRTASISSQGSAPIDQDPASTLPQTSFEDKRKENYEKGQAELERRRKALLDQQRKEAEERERKEREEIERREKARQEAERKRMDELEKQMREQQEKERLLEEERKRQAEQREAARREMERQRQLEWEKQRLQELQQQRQREQENVLKLKAKNQSLTIELSSLNSQVKDLSQKICDTRVGVSNVKTTIDGMRSTRDAQMQEMSQLKNKLKDQNAKLLALSQEKIKLEAKNKMNTHLSGPDAEHARLAFENKEITIKNLKQKITDMQSQIDGKLLDIENNNTQLEELKTQLKTLVSECEKLYKIYDDKRTKVLEMKSSSRSVDYDNAWKSNDAWGEDSTPTGVADWPVDNWSTTGTTSLDLDNIPGVHKYRAIYEFVARNNDEISFQPGDIINVPEQQTGEPGWLAGEIRGHTGWFPESYVEPVDGVGIQGASGNITSTLTDNTIEAVKLEGITEVPENIDTTTTVMAVSETTPPAVISNELEGEPEYYIANYPYQSQEPGDLTFNAGEVIGVYKKDGDWWTGKLGDNVGIFPSNYVQKVDVNTSSAATNDASPHSIGVSAADVTSALEKANAQIDNEVSQINENKPVEKPLDASITSSAQVVKGKKPEIASVIAPYQATSSEQLSLARGQLIMIRKKTDSGWWEGELQAKGRKRQVGWFPASYVKVLNSTGRVSGRTTPVSTTRIQQEVVIDKVVALYPYKAGNPDELSFEKDDIISVTAREEEAWWRGEVNGVSGLFPSNYVAPLQQQ